MVHQTFLSTISRFRPSKALPVLTVAMEIDAASLVLVAGAAAPAGGDGFQIIERKRFPAKDAAEMAQCARDFAAMLLPRASSVRWVVSFPRRQALLRFMTLPSLDPQELKTMAALQARAGLPLAEDEWISDMMVLRQNKEKRSSETLVAIVRKTTMNPYTEFFEQARIYPEGFILSSFALAAFVRHTVPDSVGDYAHLDFAEEWMTIDLFSRRQLMSSRSIPFAGKGFDPDRIIEECRYSLAAVPRTQPMYVTGAQEPLTSRLAPALQSALGISATFLSPEGENPEAIPASVLGAAGVNPKGSLMLLPPKMVKEQFRQNKRQALIGAALWAAVWLALVVGTTGLRIFQKERDLASLEADLKRLEPRVQGISEAVDRITASREDEGADPLEVLRELHLRAPAAVVLRTASCESGGRCVFQGSAPTLSAAMEFVDHLQKSAAFSQVVLTGSSISSDKNAEHIDFQIQGESKAARIPGGIDG